MKTLTRTLQSRSSQRAGWTSLGLVTGTLTGFLLLPAVTEVPPWWEGGATLATAGVAAGLDALGQAGAVVFELLANPAGLLRALGVEVPSPGDLL